MANATAFKQTQVSNEWPSTSSPTFAHHAGFTNVSDSTSRHVPFASSSNANTPHAVNAEHSTNMNEFGDCTLYRLETMSDKLTEVSLLYEETLQRLLVARDNTRQLQTLRDIACASVPEKKYQALKQSYSELLEKQTVRQRELEDAAKQNAELDQRLVVAEQDSRDKQASCRRLDKQLELKKELFQTREEEYLNEINSLRRKLDDAVGSLNTTQAQQNKRHVEQQRTNEQTIEKLTKTTQQLQAELTAANDLHQRELQEQLSTANDRWQAEVEQREQTLSLIRQKLEAQSEAVNTTQQQLRDQLHVQQAASRQSESEKSVLRQQIKQLRNELEVQRKSANHSSSMRLDDIEADTKQLLTFADNASTNILQLDVRFVALDTALSHRRHTLDHALANRQQDFAQVLSQIGAIRQHVNRAQRRRAHQQIHQQQQTDPDSNCKNIADVEAARAETKTTKQQLGAEIRRIKKLLEEAQRSRQNSSQTSTEERLDELQQQHLHALECLRREQEDRAQMLLHDAEQERDQLRVTHDAEIVRSKTATAQLKSQLSKANEQHLAVKNQYEHELETLKRQTEQLNLRVAEITEQLKTERERHLATKTATKKLKQQIIELRRTERKQVESTTSSTDLFNRSDSASTINRLSPSLAEFTRNEMLSTQISSGSTTTLPGCLTGNNSRAAALPARRSARRSVPVTTAEIQTDAIGGRLMQSLDTLQRERDEFQFLLSMRSNELESVTAQLRENQHQLQLSTQALQRSQKQTASLRISLDEQRARLNHDSASKQAQLQQLLQERETALKDELRHVVSEREARFMSLQAEHEAEKSALLEHYERQIGELRNDVERSAQQAVEGREAELMQQLRQQREQLESQFEQRKMFQLDDALANQKQLESQISKLLKLNQITTQDFQQRSRVLDQQVLAQKNELEKLNQSLSGVQANFRQAQDLVTSLEEKLEHNRIEHEREVDRLQFEAKRENASGQQQTRAHYEQVLRETLEKFQTSHTLLSAKIESLTEQYQSEHAKRVEREREQRQRLQELDELRSQMNEKEAQLSTIRRSNEALCMNLGLAEHHFNTMFGNVLKPPSLTTAEVASIQQHQQQLQSKNVRHHGGAGEGLSVEPPVDAEKKVLYLTSSENVQLAQQKMQQLVAAQSVPASPKKVVVASLSSSSVVYNSGANKTPIRTSVKR